jgi:two-component system cell cycle sensor histidine kinase PleC
MVEAGGSAVAGKACGEPMDRSVDEISAACGTVVDPIAAIFLESCPDAAALIDTSWRPIAWNRHFIDLWQIRPGAPARAVWRRIRRLLARPGALLDSWRDAAGQSFCQIVALDGALEGERWVELRAAPPSPFAGVPARIWFCRDVTEAVLRERALVAERLRYRQLVDLSPDAIYLTRAGADGKFYPELMNATAAQITGFNLDQISGRALDEFLPAWLAPIVLEAQAQCRDTAESVHYSGKAPADQGGGLRDCVITPICDQRGKVVQTILVSRDTKQRRHEDQVLAEAAASADEAERRAAQAQARLGEAIDTLPAAFMLFDRDERLVLANSACRETFPLAAELLRGPGATMESIIRSNAAIELADPSPEAVEAFVKERLASFRAATGSSERPLVDGRWMLASDRRMPSGDTVSLRIDVTRGRQREHQLAEAARAWSEREAQLGRIYANIPGVVYQLRAEADRRLHFVYISDRSTDVFGFAPDAVYADPGLIFATCHAEDKRHFADTMAAAARALARWDCEFRIAVGGGMRWLRGSALPTQAEEGAVLWDGVFVDVTAIKEAEAGALKTRRQLEDAIENLSDGFALYDAAGSLLLCNSRQREIQAMIDPGFVFQTGVSFDAVLRSEAAAFDLDDPDTFIARRLEDCRHGNSAWDVQLASGAWLQGIERQMRDGGIVAIRRDITLLKRREEQLRTAMIEAMTANKAKSEFLANMSHELRTPLNAIIGFSEMIESEIFGALGNERYRGYVHDIHVSGQHLLNIINTVLDLARVESGKIVLSVEEIDVAALIHDCSSLMRDQFLQKNLQLTLNVEDGLPLLFADPLRLRQVLFNLLSNSIKFTQKHGHITTRADRGADGSLVIEIADTGIGMDPRHIPLAFEPFGLVQPAHNRDHPGTGLGLPLSKALVEEHGGKLELVSELGKGTTARVTLPASRLLPPDVKAEQ